MQSINEQCGKMPHFTYIDFPILTLKLRIGAVQDL